MRKGVSRYGMECQVCNEGVYMCGKYRCVGSVEGVGLGSTGVEERRQQWVTPVRYKMVVVFQYGSHHQYIFYFNPLPP